MSCNHHEEVKAIVERFVEFFAHMREMAQEANHVFRDMKTRIDVLESNITKLIEAVKNG